MPCSDGRTCDIFLYVTAHSFIGLYHDVGFGVLLAVLVPCFKEIVLPVHDVSRRDVDDPHLAEERDELLVDHMLLAAPGSLPQPGAYILGVDLDELFEGHARRPGLVGQKVPLPCQGLGLGLEPRFVESIVSPSWLV